MKPPFEKMEKGLFYQLVLCVATLLNSWPDSSGITGRDRVESVAGMKWNHWPGSRGMRGRDRLEFAFMLMLLHKQAETAFTVAMLSGKPVGVRSIILLGRCEVNYHGCLAQLNFCQPFHLSR